MIESGILERLKKSDPDFIGPWKLINRLGSGGMSVVYQASKNERTSVALKVIRSQYLDNQVDRNRIEREISTLTQIKSKFVCQIIDSDITEDFAWIATEYINGPDLKTKVNLDGPYAEDDWYLLYKGLLEGLKIIHAYGVIHRDIKPTNILISADGPKIIDFGIAQSSEATSLTSTGLIAGSPAWLSPEQINGDKVTYSSDIFSVGAVLNFAVSGISPWGDNTKITKDVIYNRILQKQPDLSSLSILQKFLVEKMMEKSPKSRPSADQALIYLNDRWSQEAKLKKQIEEREKEHEKEEKQKRKEQLDKRRNSNKRLKKVILNPLLMRKKIISLFLASVFILVLTGTYAFTSYTSKSGIFNFLAGSDSLEIKDPEKINAQPQLKTVDSSIPVLSKSPTPSPSASIATSKIVERETTEPTIKNSQEPKTTTIDAAPTFIEVGGEKIDLNKTRICLSIFQPMGFEPDRYCFKDRPKISKPQGYAEQKYISGYSVPLTDLITLYVPFEKANIMGCTLNYLSFKPEYYTNGIPDQLVYGVTTYTLNYNDSKISEFCKKWGEWKYGYSIKPIYNVLVFSKNQKLPLDFTFRILDSKNRINMVWTWSKI